MIISQPGRGVIVWPSPLRATMLLNAASARLPRAYIHGTEDGRIARLTKGFAKYARESGWLVREIATGHDAMLTVPVELASMPIVLAGLEHGR